MEKFIAYLRRSKKEQSSTLGLKAQEDDVKKYVDSKNGQLINMFIEIESGTSKRLNRRTIIWDAIDACKTQDATLVIAKLDRLARDVEFTSRLMNSGVKFIACDIPVANEFTIHVMAAVAEQEAKRIAERTRSALQHKKASGYKLGWNTHKEKKSKLTYEHRVKGGQFIKERALSNPNNLRAKGYAEILRSQKLTYQQIADVMNGEGFTSPNNNIITPNTVARWLFIYKEPVILDLLSA